MTDLNFYVVGVYLTNTDDVVSARKLVGGSRKPGENNVDTLMRVFHMKTEINTTKQQWVKQGQLQCGDDVFNIYVFNEEIELTEPDNGLTMLDWVGEENDDPTDVVAVNLHWLLPLCLEPRGFKRWVIQLV